MRSLFSASSVGNLRLRSSARNEVADVNDVTASATAVAYLHSVSALSHLVVPPTAVSAGGVQLHLDLDLLLLVLRREMSGFLADAILPGLTDLRSLHDLLDTLKEGSLDHTLNGVNERNFNQLDGWNVDNLLVRLDYSGIDKLLLCVHASPLNLQGGHVDQLRLRHLRWYLYHRMCTGKRTVMVLVLDF